MLNYKIFVPFFSAIFLTASTGLAQEIGQTTVSSGVSTFGANVEVAYQIDPLIRIRGALAGLPNLDALSGSFEEDGTTFEYDATIGAIVTLVDFYPTSSGWRVSGGFLYNQTELTANATLTADNTFTVDNGTEIESGRVDVVSSFKKQVSPMITSGYDYKFQDKWVLGVEIGAIYTGGVDLDVSSTDSRLQAEIDNDSDIQEARNAADDLTYYPYVSISVGYQF